MRPEAVVLAASIVVTAVEKTSDVDLIPYSVVVATVEAVVAPLVEPRGEVDSFKDAVAVCVSGFRPGNVLAFSGVAEGELSVGMGAVARVEAAPASCGVGVLSDVVSAFTSAPAEVGLSG